MESVAGYAVTEMMSFRKISDGLRRWLVGVIKEAVTPPVKPPPKSGHVQFMKFAAARSLLADGATVEQAAAAAGVEPEDLRHFISPRRRR